MTKRIGNSRLYILIFIGIVSAFGPFVTDFYLPALPVLSEYFDTTASLVQQSDFQYGGIGSRAINHRSTERQIWT